MVHHYIAQLRWNVSPNHPAVLTWRPHSTWCTYYMFIYKTVLPFDLPLVIWCLTVQALPLLLESESSLLSDASLGITLPKWTIAYTNWDGLASQMLGYLPDVTQNTQPVNLHCHWGCIVKFQRLKDYRNDRADVFSKHCCFNPIVLDILVLCIVCFISSDTQEARMVGINQLR